MKKTTPQKKRETQRTIVCKDHALIFSGCKNHDALTSPHIAGEVIEMVVKSGFTFKGELLCPFPDVTTRSGANCSYTLMICIGESRIDLHSWPEKNCLHVGICYCDFSQDNSEKKELFVQALKEKFKPKKVTELPVRIIPIK